MIAAPVTITVCALIGVVVTSASSEILGEIIWSPIGLLSALQDYYQSSPAIRAACFFAGLGLTGAQLSINVVLNSVSTGMDMAGLWPKYINIRRGAYILAAVSCVTSRRETGDSPDLSLVSPRTLGRFSRPPRSFSMSFPDWASSLVL